jgi:hypothetical protein
VWDDLQEEPNADASCPVFVVFRPHDQAEKLPVRRDLISIGKSNLQSHSDQVVRHASRKLQPVAREINYQTDIFDIPETDIERTQMYGKRNRKTLPSSRVVLRFSGCSAREPMGSP